MTLDGALSISAMGLDAQTERIQVHSANIANLHTPNYIRQIPVLTQNSVMPFDAMLAQMRSGGVIGTLAQSIPQGVRLSGTVNDPTPGKRIYMPDHPEADKLGYVTMSNSNVLGDMADAMGASRMYEANLAMVGTIRSMANKAIELGKGR